MLITSSYFYTSIIKVKRFCSLKSWLGIAPSVYGLRKLAFQRFARTAHGATSRSAGRGLYAPLRVVSALFIFLREVTKTRTELSSNDFFFNSLIFVTNVKYIQSFSLWKRVNKRQNFNMLIHKIPELITGLNRPNSIKNIKTLTYH